MAKHEKITLELTKQESLVLFDLLCTFFDEGQSIAPSKGEEWLKDTVGVERDLVLNVMHGQLESKLSEPFSEKYNSSLSAARKQVVDSFFGEEK